MQRWARIAFLVLLAAALALLYRTIHPFVVPVLLAGILVVFSYPLQRWLVRRTGGRRRLAAFLSTFVLFFCFVLPAAGMVVLVLREVAAALPQLRELLLRLEASDLAGPDSWMGRVFSRRVATALPNPRELVEQLGGTLGQAATAALGGIAAATARLVVDAFLMFVAAYYFFLDGPALLNHFVRLVPVEDRYLRELFHEFRIAVIAVFFGTAVVALVQGVLAGVAFLIIGVPAFLWAAVTTVVALLPLIGPFVVWVPMAVVLAVTGNTWQAIFLSIWGAVLVSTVDNVLRPLLVKGRMHVHPLLVFLTIFGGLAAFGMIGFLLGPIVAALCMAMLRIWERDFYPRPPGPVIPASS